MSCLMCVVFFKQKTAYELRISDWSSDVCSSDLQMVLGLLPKEKIRAVSFEADSDTSFAVPRALGIERLRPQLEDIVAARPAVVVRSYGGDARLDGQLNAMGIRDRKSTRLNSSH